MLEFSVLSSGSKANCLYVSDGTTRVLVDCGLSARQAAVRLSELGIDPDSIDAIVVSHEHSDHVSGVRVFSKRHQVPVLTNRMTLAASSELSSLCPTRVQYFETGDTFAVGEMRFEPFSIVHDAADPVAFRVSSGNKTLGIVTDLGQVTTLVRERVRNLDAIVLESNHDLDMLHDAPYPWALKQRISSRQGHLSNEMAATLLTTLNDGCGKRPEIVVAAHISENSNTPELAVEVLRTGWDAGLDRTMPEFVAGCPTHASELFKLS